MGYLRPASPKRSWHNSLSVCKCGATFEHFGQWKIYYPFMNRNFRLSNPNPHFIISRASYAPNHNNNDSDNNCSTRKTRRIIIFVEKHVRMNVCSANFCSCCSQPHVIVLVPNSVESKLSFALSMSIWPGAVIWCTHRTAQTQTPTPIDGMLRLF